MIPSPTQSDVKAAVREFAQNAIKPRANEFERAGRYPNELFLELGEMGLLGMTAPESVGGAGFDYVSYALALIELAAADGALSTIVSIQNSIMVQGILRFGSESQHQRYLHDLIGGRMIGAFALTEADAGSDAASIRTRAIKTANGWRINGTKQFITSGMIASLAMVTAVTDPAAGKRGLSCFLVPTASAGYEVAGVESKLGQRASDTCSLRFENLDVPADALFGEEGHGYKVALANLETGRIGIAAQSVGMAQAALDIAIDYAKQRKSMGKAIFEHQAVGFRLASLATKLEAARQLVLHAASLKDAGYPCIKEASMCKLLASETAEEVVSGAMQTLGGYGYTEDYGIAKIYRDVRVCQIYEGTSDIQRMVIARELT